MGRPIQAVDTLDRDGRCPLAFDLRAHATQAMGQINDLGFAGGVFQHRGALCECRRHQRVFSRPNRHDREIHHRPLEAALGLGMDIAVAQFQIGAHRLQRLEVQIDGPRADGATAGQRHNRPPITRQHRPQHEDRGAHLAHDIVIGGMVVQPMRRQRQNPPAVERRHLGAQRLQQRRHGADIA